MADNGRSGFGPREWIMLGIILGGLGVADKVSTFFGFGAPPPTKIELVGEAADDLTDRIDDLDRRVKQHNVDVLDQAEMQVKVLESLKGEQEKTTNAQNVTNQLLTRMLNDGKSPAGGEQR
jgi:hypothetical protein